MLELLQKHIRQRDLMDLHEQLVRLLALGYTSRRQLKTLLHYLLQAGNAADPVTFLRHLAQNVPRRPHKETLMNIAQFLEQRGHQQGLKQGLEQGLQQGIEQGIEKGIEQGEQQTAERIARAMLANGLDLSLVAKLTKPRPGMSGPAAALIIPLSTRAAPIVRRQLSVFVNVSALIIINMNITGVE